MNSDLPGLSLSGMLAAMRTSGADPTAAVSAKTLDLIEDVSSSLESIGSAFAALKARPADTAILLHTLGGSVRVLHDEIDQLPRDQTKEIQPLVHERLLVIKRLLHELILTPDLREEQRAGLAQITHLIDYDTHLMNPVGSVEGSGLFNTFFLGSTHMELELQDTTTPVEFVASTLQQMLTSNSFPPKEAEAVKKLIKQYHTAIEIANTMRRAHTQQTPAECRQAMQEVKNLILSSLEREGEILLQTGYSSPPGHAILLQLKRTVDAKGTVLISGELANRGQGLTWHSGSILYAFRHRGAPFMALLPTPPEALEKSGFLNLLTELSFTTLPREGSTRERSNYDIEDFYEVVVPLWPGGLEVFARDQEVRAAQRGLICGTIAWITPFQEVVSVQSAWRIKLVLRMRAMERLIRQSDLHFGRAAHLEWALEKTGRTLKKLVDSGAQADTEQHSFVALRKQVKRRILEIRTTERSQREALRRGEGLDARAAAQTCDLSRIQPVQKPAPAQPNDTTIFPPIWKGYERYWYDYKAEYHKEADSLPPSDFCTLYEILFWNSGTDKAVKLGWNYLSTFSNPTLSAKEIRTLRVVLAGNLYEASGIGTSTVVGLTDCVSVGRVVVNYLREITRQNSDPESLLKEYPKALITHRAREVLGIFEGALPQLRSCRPHERQAVLALMGELRDLCAGMDGLPIIAEIDPGIHKGVSIHSSGYSRADDVYSDPVTAAFVEIVKQYPEAFADDWLNSDKPSPEIAALRFRGYRLNAGEGKKLPPALDHLVTVNLLLEDCQRLLYQSVGCGAAPDFMRFVRNEPNYGYRMDLTRNESGPRNSPLNNADDQTEFSTTAVTIDRHLAGLIPLYPDSASLGAYIQALYPWGAGHNTKEARVLECQMAALFLDRRVREHQKTHLTQNQQLTLRKDVEFGTTTLPAFEVQEILSILLNDDMIVPQTIRYFERHFYRLKDPRFQALLEGFLLTPRPDTGQAALGYSAPGSDLTSRALIRFLANGIQRAERQKMVGAQMQLLRLLAVAIFNFDAEGKKDLSQTAEKELIAALDSLARNTSLKDTDLTTSLHWQIALYPYVAQHEQLTKRCAAAFNQLNIVGGVCKFDSRYAIEHDFNRAVEALGDPTAPLNRLPRWVLSSKLYVFHADNPSVVVEGDRYCFTDSNGRPSAIEIQGKTFTCYQKRRDSLGQERWFRSLNENLLVHESLDSTTHPCGSMGYLGSDSRYWLSENAPLEGIAEDRKDEKLKYRVVNGRVIHPSVAGLFLSSNYPPTGEVRQLMGLDSEHLVLAWVDASERVQRIEYPALNLILSLSKDPMGIERWYSSLHSGLFAAPHVVAMEIEPCRHYLVLEDSKGRRTVIVSNSRIRRGRVRSHNEYSFTLARSDRPRLLTYKTDPATGKMLPSSDPERLLYQLCLDLELCRYQSARNMIRRLKLHPMRWTPSMKEMMEWIQDTGDSRDKHSRAVALRLQLGLLLRASEPSKPLTHRALQAIGEDYVDYLDQLNALTNYKLSERDENRVIQLLEESGIKNFIIAERKAILGGMTLKPMVHTYARTPASVALEHLVLNEEWITNPIQSDMLKASKTPVKLYFELRPGRAFVTNFLYYYRILKQSEPNSAEYEQVVRILRLSRRGVDRETEMLRRLLFEVMRSPSEYPPANELMDAAGRNELRVVLAPIMVRLNSNRQTVDHRQWSFQGHVRTGGGTLRLNPERVVLFPTPEEAAATARSNAASVKKPPAVSTARADDSPIGHDIVDSLLDSGFMKRESPADQKARVRKEIQKLTELRAVYKLAPGVSNPCTDRSCERTIAGIDEKIGELEQEKEPLCAITSPESVAACADRIRLAQTHGNTRLDEMRAEIVDIIHDFTPEAKLRIQAGLLEKMSFDELILCFGRQDDQSIITANPQLAGQMPQLRLRIRHYLVQLTEVQRLERALVQANATLESTVAKGWNHPATQSEARALVAALVARRAYNTTYEDTLLAFEALIGMRLRPDQVSDLKNLTLGGLFNAELEARTGYGKSKVLIPLWLFLTRQRGRLTMMTVPQSLIEDQTAHLREMLGNHFALGIQRLDITREQANDDSYLVWLNEQLSLAEKEGRIVILSINSLHNLTGLALKESLMKRNLSVSERLLAIRKTLAERVSNFIDESAECLDNRQRFDYAVGIRGAVAQDRCIEEGQLFRELILNPTILDHWNFSFLPQLFDINKRVLTEANYPELREELVEHAMNMFRVPADNRTAIRAHLMGSYSTECEPFLTSLSEANLRAYSRIRRQLAVHLPRTLFRDYHSRYTLGADRIAIPSRQGNPRPASEFATLDDLLNFTVQGNLRVPFSVDDMRLYTDSLLELQEERGDAAHRAPSYQLYQSLQLRLDLPPLADLTHQHLEKIANYINSAQGLTDRLQLIVVHVLPKVFIFAKKISASSYSLIGALGHVQAASGLTNPDTLPPSMKTMERRTAPIANLLALWKNSQAKVFVIPDGPPAATLTLLLRQHPSSNVLTDSRGLLSDLPDTEITETILDLRPDCKGVVFYDAEGRCMMRERAHKAPILREDSQLQPEEIFIFIRKGKSIGSDTPMSLVCNGLITGGLNVSASFFEQGAGRMRKLTEGQTLGVVCTESEVQVMQAALKVTGERFTLAHYMQYTKLEEGRERGLDYYASLAQYLEFLILQGLHRPDDGVADLRLRFLKLQDRIVTATEVDPLRELRSTLKPLQPSEAIAELKAKMLDPIKADGRLAKVVNVKAIESEFDRYVDLSKMPATVSVSDTSGTEDAVVEVDKEKESETDQEQAQDIEQQTARPLPELNLKPLDRQMWDGDYQRWSSDKGKRVIAGVTINPSPNWRRDVEGREAVRKPAFQYVLSVGDNGTLAIMPLDVVDGAAVLTAMSKNQSASARGTSYYLLSGDHVLSYHVSGDRVALRLNQALAGDALARVGIIAKILCGDLYLNEQESAWIEGNPKEAQEIAWLCDKYRHYWPDLSVLAGQLPKLSKRTIKAKGRTGLIGGVMSYLPAFGWGK